MGVGVGVGGASTEVVVGTAVAGVVVAPDPATVRVVLPTAVVLEGCTETMMA